MKNLVKMICGRGARSCSKKKLNILVVGCKGQLGSWLLKSFSEDAMKASSPFNVVVGCDLPEVDISKRYCLDEYLNQSVVAPPIKFHWVINCAAVTNTTAIEVDRNTRDLSYAVNVLGPKHIASSCAYHKSKMIHISTDYVFSEKSVPMDEVGSPIKTGIEEFPRSMYGLHKLLGEREVQLAFKDHPEDFMILRTSWLYGNSESSFPVKFLKNCLAAKKSGKTEVEVVDDCFGRPTSVQYLTKFIRAAIVTGLGGVVDAQAPSDPISRLDFATKVLDSWNFYAGHFEPTIPENLDLTGVAIKACKTSDLPEAAQAVDHPKDMPIFSRTSEISTTTPLFAMTRERLKEMLNQVYSCSVTWEEIYSKWLSDEGGYKLLENALLNCAS